MSRHNYITVFFLAVLDVNECTTEAHICDDNAECVNTEGSYECTCKDGFHGDRKKCTGNWMHFVCILFQLR